jgi:hypothetical protein
MAALGEELLLPFALGAGSLAVVGGTGRGGGLLACGGGLLALGAWLVAPAFVLLLSPSPLPPIGWSLCWVGVSWR